MLVLIAITTPILSLLLICTLKMIFHGRIARMMSIEPE